MQYYAEHRDVKEVVRVFDSNLSLKANKGEVLELHKKLEHYVSKQDIEDLSNEVDYKIEQFKSDISDQNNRLEVLQNKMSEAVYEAVKRANAQIRHSIEKSIEEKETRSILSLIEKPKSNEDTTTLDLDGNI